MAVKIRLMRMGKKKQPTYRVVVADSRSPRNGRYIEIIGTYGPRQEPAAVTLDDERALAWLRQGAQPTDQVRRLLDQAGVWERFHAERGRKPPAPRRAAPKPAPAEPAPVAEAPAAEPAADADDSPAGEES